MKIDTEIIVMIEESFLVEGWRMRVGKIGESLQKMRWRFLEKFVTFTWSLLHFSSFLLSIIFSSVFLFFLCFLFLIFCYLFLFWFFSFSPIVHWAVLIWKRFWLCSWTGLLMLVRVPLVLFGFFWIHDLVLVLCLLIALLTWCTNWFWVQLQVGFFMLLD